MKALTVPGGRAPSITWWLKVSVALLLFAMTLASTADAFRFSLVPGKVKCFTSQIQEDGRYEVRYFMARSLSPLVSVSVTSPGGRILFEHEIAKPSAKEIVTVKQEGDIAICFNTAAKASLTATSLNVTLEVVDAEDAELTRMKKQTYSTSSPIALGAGQGSGALRQMEYIFRMVTQIRYSFSYLMHADEDMRFAFRDAEKLSWVMVYIFVGIALAITLTTFFRLKRFMAVKKII